MNRVRLYTTVLAMVIAAIGPNLVAQEKEHAHSAPHGGMVITVGKEYHFELVVKDKEMNLYVLDAREKTLPVKDVTGEIVLLVAKEKRTLKLTPAGEFLKAEGDFAKAAKFTAVATLAINGKSQSGRFAYTKGGHHDEKKNKHHDEKDEHHENK